MSDKQDSWRAAQPAFFGLVPTRGDPKNILNDEHKKFGKSASNSMKPFLKQHYNMLREYSHENMSVTDLIHFHVYGEYRTILRDGAMIDVPRTFPYPFIPNPPIPRDLQQSGISLHSHARYGRSDGRDTLHGIRARTRYAATEIDVTEELQAIEVPFFRRLIASGAPGRIFFLPSIGTMLLAVSPYTTEWPRSLRSYFAGQPNKSQDGRIPKLFSRVVFNRDNETSDRLSDGSRDLFYTPWFEDAPVTDDVFMDVWVQAGFDETNLPTDAGGAIFEINLFFITWVHTLMESRECQDIPNRDEVLTSLCKAAIAATFTTGNRGLTEHQYNQLMNHPGHSYPNDYENASSMNIYGACSEFFAYMEAESIVGMASSALVGRLFAFDTDSDYYDRLFNQNVDPNNPANALHPSIELWVPHENFGADKAYESVGPWTVTNETGGGSTVTIQQLAQELDYDDDGNVVGYLEGDDNTVIREIRNVQLSILERCDSDGNVLEEDEDAEPGVTAADATSTLTYVSRLLIDCYFEMETFLMLALNANKIDFRRFSSEQKQNDDNLNPDFFSQGSGKKTTKVADFLAEQRANLMQGYLASLMAHTNDREMRTLFDGDLMLTEVDWYTKTIASRLLAATAERIPTSALASREFEEPRGPVIDVRDPDAGGRVLPMGIVQPTTILRTLDVPTLRIIMNEYFQSFYQRVAVMAEELDANPPKKKKGKKGKGKAKLLIEQMWDTVEATVATTLSLEGIRPSEMWAVTFASVERARSDSNDRSTPILPPSWAGRFFRADLIRDPRVTGETADIEKHVSLFKNYISFLKSTYSRNYFLVGSLLTAFQTIAARSIKDIDELQQFFSKRLTNDEKFAIRGRRFNAYRTFIYICRTFLSMPAYDAALEVAELRDAEMLESRTDPLTAPELSPVVGAPDPQLIGALTPYAVGEAEMLRGGP